MRRSRRWRRTRQDARGESSYTCPARAAPGRARRLPSRSSPPLLSEAIDVPRLLRRAAGLLAGCALLLSLAAPAVASSGVSVDLGRIEITEQLAPGSAYNLPS